MKNFDVFCSYKHINQHEDNLEFSRKHFFKSNQQSFVLNDYLKVLLLEKRVLKRDTKVVTQKVQRNWREFLFRIETLNVLSGPRLDCDNNSQPLWFHSSPCPKERAPSTDAALLNEVEGYFSKFSSPIRLMRGRSFAMTSSMSKDVEFFFKEDQKLGHVYKRYMISNKSFVMDHQRISPKKLRMQTYKCVLRKSSMSEDKGFASRRSNAWFLG